MRFAAKQYKIDTTKKGFGWFFNMGMFYYLVRQLKAADGKQYVERKLGVKDDVHR